MFITFPIKYRKIIDRQKAKNMNKNRVSGALKQVKGAIGEKTGKVLGDAKLVAEGKADKSAGKIQNAIGSVTDALKK